jgi:ribosomal protein S18 acetylase RimI-like enzyme
MGRADLAVVELGEERLAEVGPLLERAFEGDPVARYVMGQGPHRAGVISWLYGKSVQYAVRHGRAHTTRELAGVAAWLGPEHPYLRPIKTLVVGFGAAPVKLGLAAFCRLLRYNRLKERLHRQAMGGQAHWYLLIIGVDPDAQGGGVGSSLLAAHLRLADAQRLACYTETARQENVKFFEKHHFAVTGEDDLPGGPKVWGLSRVHADTRRK